MVGLRLLFLGIYVSLFVLWEIAAYLLLYQVCYKSRLAAFLAMVIEGARQALGVCRLRNGMLLPYLLLVLPFQVVMTWSGLYLSVEIPHFILDFLGKAPFLLAGANLLLLGVQVLGIEGVFFFHFLFLRGKSAPEAWASSRNMGLWRLGKTCLWLCCWDVLWSFGTFLFYLGVVAIAFLLPSSEYALLLVDGIVWSLLQLQKLLFVPISIGIVHSCYLLFMQSEMMSSCSPWLTLRKRTLVFVLCCIGVGLLGGGFLYHGGGKDGSSIAPNPVMPMIAAHRGDTAAAPENTLAAIGGAADIGVACIEIDVQMTKDGQLVLFHDRDLCRVLGVSKTVGELNYDEVMALVSQQYASDAPETRPFPLLKDALAAGGKEMVWNIEIKTHPWQTIWGYFRLDSPMSFGFLGRQDEDAFGPWQHRKREMVARVVSLLTEERMQGRVIISSLDYEVLQLVKNENPDFETLYLLPFVSSYVGDLPAADGYSIEISALSPHVYREIKEKGKKLWVWTINDAAATAKLSAYEVDGVITDRPLLLEKILNRSQEKKYNQRQFFQGFLFS
ncbi:MAG: hypothetical protein HFI72_05245 [Peptococcaceae bacterium]|nr:hypothetical protein [Peptococcaceae bacterium]